MSVVFYGVFLITGSHFAGLIASVSALLNLFNLLPVYPLDGGHVVKSLVLSGRRAWGFTVLIALSAVCFALALAFGLYFLSFFVVIGVVDLLASQRQLAAHAHAPLDRNGIVYCTLWYFAVVVVLIAIIVLMARSGVPGSEIATAILQS
jgi:Zn-dependent protease